MLNIGRRLAAILSTGLLMGLCGTSTVGATPVAHVTQMKFAHGTSMQPLIIHGSLHPESQGVLSIRPDFVSRLEGFIADDKGLLETEDGGTTWTRVNTPHGFVQNIDFSNRRVGFVVVCKPSVVNPNDTVQRARYTLYHTTDGGRVWRQVWSKRALSGLQPDLSSLQVIGSNTLVLRVDNDAWVSHNGGKRFARQRMGGRAIDVIRFTSPTAGYAVTTSPTTAGSPDRLSVWETHDGGAHWHRQYQTRAGNWSDVQLSVHNAKLLMLA